MATKKVSAKKSVAPAKAVPSKTVPAVATKSAKKAASPAVPAKKMSKTELYRTLAEKLSVPAKQVGTFFEVMVETAVEQTKSSGEFTIPGLGKLVKAERKERMGRNPATGESITIAAKTDVKFRVAKAIKENIAPPKQ